MKWFMNLFIVSFLFYYFFSSLLKTFLLMLKIFFCLTFITIGFHLSFEIIIRSFIWKDLTTTWRLQDYSRDQKTGTKSPKILCRKQCFIHWTNSRDEELVHTLITWHEFKIKAKLIYILNAQIISNPKTS